MKQKKKNSYILDVFLYFYCLQYVEQIQVIYIKENVEYYNLFIIHYIIRYKFLLIKKYLLLNIFSSIYTILHSRTVPTSLLEKKIKLCIS